MKAAIRSRFGSPEVISVEEVEEPTLTPDGVLVQVRAASPNRADWYAMTGKPYFARVQMGLFKPKEIHTASPPPPSRTPAWRLS